MIQGIPACVPKANAAPKIPLPKGISCLTLVYTPAPDQSGAGFSPEKQYSSLDDFTAGTKCELQVCNELYRVHLVIKSIMANNSINGKPSPIPPQNVLGFRNETALDQYLLDNPDVAQGGYIFAVAPPPNPPSITFVMQMNSTSSEIRGVWQRPYFEIGLPMQVPPPQHTQVHLASSFFPSEKRWRSFLPSPSPEHTESILSSLSAFQCSMKRGTIRRTGLSSGLQRAITWAHTP